MDLKVIREAKDTERISIPNKIKKAINRKLKLDNQVRKGIITVTELVQARNGISVRKNRRK